MLRNALEQTDPTIAPPTTTSPAMAPSPAPTKGRPRSAAFRGGETRPDAPGGFDFAGLEIGFRELVQVLCGPPSPLLSQVREISGPTLILYR